MENFEVIIFFFFYLEGYNVKHVQYLIFMKLHTFSKLAKVMKLVLGRL